MGSFCCRQALEIQKPVQLLFAGLGYGSLALSIEGPSKVDINCEDVEDGTCKVTYCPTEPGNYAVNIKFAEKHIPGWSLLKMCVTNTES